MCIFFYDGVTKKYFLCLFIVFTNDITYFKINSVYSSQSELGSGESYVPIHLILREHLCPSVVRL